VILVLVSCVLETSRVPGASSPLFNNSSRNNSNNNNSNNEFSIHLNIDASSVFDYLREA